MQKCKRPKCILLTFWPWSIVPNDQQHGCPGALGSNAQTATLLHGAIVPLAASPLQDNYGSLIGAYFWNKNCTY